MFKIAEAHNRPVKDWEDFEPEEEKLLSEIIFKETGSEFVFVTHYPSVKRPFYAMDSKEHTNETVSICCLEDLKLQPVVRESIIMKNRLQK